jgi:ecotin
MILIIPLLTLPLSADNNLTKNISMYPQAIEGFQRYIIELPKTEDDSNHKVELLIGKMMMVDCNQRFLSGSIKSKMVKGWGYPYIEVNNIQNGPSTMMMCHEPKEKKYLSIKDILRRYNSRLPIVVYIPKGYEVQYRIWNAGDNIKQ